MNEDDPPHEPQGDDLAEPPPAVQWMMQQAALGQSSTSRPAPMSHPAALTSDSASSEAVLAARRRRISDALRGNERLTEGLYGEAASALLALGLDMGQSIVEDTAGLDDAAAEDILQPRVRAVRRLMMAAATAGAEQDAVEPAEWMEQAAVALGDRFAPADKAEQSALGDEWRSASDPAGQIAVLCRFIETHTVSRS